MGGAGPKRTKKHTGTGGSSTPLPERSTTPTKPDKSKPNGTRSKHKRSPQGVTFDRFQVQKLVDLIEFYNERGWDVGLALEFLVLEYAGVLK